LPVPEKSSPARGRRRQRRRGAYRTLRVLAAHHLLDVLTGDALEELLRFGCLHVGPRKLCDKSRRWARALRPERGAARPRGPQRYVDIARAEQQRRRPCHRAIVSQPPRTSGRQPEGGEASSVDSRLAASPPGGTGRVSSMASPSAALWGVKHTAATGWPPCPRKSPPSRTRTCAELP